MCSDAIPTDEPRTDEPCRLLHVDQTLSVPPGSLVVLRGVHLPPEVQDTLVPRIAEVVGHRQFLVVNLGDPTASVDVVHDPEAMRRLLGLAAEAADQRRAEGSPPHFPPCPLCGQPDPDLADVADA